VRVFLALGLAGVVAVLLQTTVLPWLLPPRMGPDLTVALAVYLGSRHQSVGGVLGVFLLGYFVDAFSGLVPAAHAFALVAVYAFVYVVARNVWMRGVLPIMLIAFLAAWVDALALAGVRALVADPADVWHHVVRSGLVEAGTTALVAPAVFAAVGWEKRLLGLR
jgi:hypothetical protein